MQKVDAATSLVRQMKQPVCLADLKAKQASKNAAVRESLVSNGYVTLQQQAEALSLSRSSAWSLVRGNYKSSGLSANTIKHILSSPTLPSSTRALINEYVRERFRGIYGHSPVQLKRFRQRLGHQLDQGPRIERDYPGYLASPENPDAGWRV